MNASLSIVERMVNVPILWEASTVTVMKVMLPIKVTFALVSKIERFLIECRR